MLLGLIVYMVGAPKVLGNIGIITNKEKVNWTAVLKYSVITSVSISLLYFIYSLEAVKEIVSTLYFKITFLLLGLTALVYYFRKWFKSIPIKEERDRLSVIFVLLFFVTFFWAGFEQAGSTLTLFTDKFIDRTLFGWEIPTTFFQAANPLFIIILGPIFTFLWPALAKKGKNPSTPIKMGIGMILLGAGFVFMVGAVMQRGGNSEDVAIKASMMWLMMTYLFHTVGELFISPIGLSMVTKLAPVRLASLMMGAWFLSSFAANLIAGLSVKYVEQLGALNVFTIIAAFVGVCGVIVLFLSRWLLNRMHGAD